MISSIYFFYSKEKVSKAKLSHLCQRPLDHAGCKSRDVHEWQGLEGESQQANLQDRSPQYFSDMISSISFTTNGPKETSNKGEISFTSSVENLKNNIRNRVNQTVLNLVP
ncbi:hypothetical protein Fot_11510 [Forsythia ovata]|uniref:Uncharacterized protein n=1 Tax=Forsythia ovata TaxID=205694 RepID=A0ABD1WNL7_9LAMI